MVPVGTNYCISNEVLLTMTESMVYGGVGPIASLISSHYSQVKLMGVVLGNVVLYLERHKGPAEWKEHLLS